MTEEENDFTIEKDPQYIDTYKVNSTNAFISFWATPKVLKNLEDALHKFRKDMIDGVNDNDN